MAIRVGQLNYNPMKIVGRGSFGTIVYQGLLGLYDGGPVAVKRIQRDNYLDESETQCEAELMKRAGNHPNILRYIHQEKNENFL